MKVKWFKALAMIAILSIGPLVMTQAVFSAMRTDSLGFPLSFGTVFGSFLSRIDSASESSVLLILGAILILLGVRIRQLFAVRVGQ
jgi:hypothetical protein